MEAQQIIWGPCTMAEIQSKLIPWYAQYCLRNSAVSMVSRFTDYFKPFRKDLILVVEYPYTDKVFRDSYYHFHAAKYRTVSRDCMRVFLFEPSVQLFDPQNLGQWSLAVNDEIRQQYQAAFLGYIVLRPLPQWPFGRAMINPLALARHNFVTCLSKSTCSFMGTKLSVCAFPHESKDAETHMCAETAIWSIFEYYGNQYAEHRPVLPSEIIRALQTGASRRLLPSKGLSILEIAKALQHLGHGTQTYARSVIADDRVFFRFLNIMVESGIPVIVGFDLLQGKENPDDPDNPVITKRDGHAIVITGHGDKRGTPLPAPDMTCGAIEILDAADIAVDLVSMDDNLPPYTLFSLTEPAREYKSSGYNESSRVQQFIVPLHRHMYLDIKAASDLFGHILTSTEIGLPKFVQSGKFVKRIFLTGGRSWKAWVLQEPAIVPSMKSVVVATALPRFVWVCEVSSEKNYNQSKANGFIVVDATGPAEEGSILLYCFAGKMFAKKETGEWDFVGFGGVIFGQYQNNLKGEWSKWGME